MLCNHCSLSFLFQLWNLAANNHSTHAGCCNLSVLYTICFQLPHWVKNRGVVVVDVKKRCEDALILSLLRNSKERKKKKKGRRINSLASGRALQSMQAQHFQADYLKPHFYSIFNPTVTGSVTAVVFLRVILFLYCCRLPSNPAWNSQRRKRAQYLATLMISLKE